MADAAPAAATPAPAAAPAAQPAAPAQPAAAATAQPSATPSTPAAADPKAAAPAAEPAKPAAAEVKYELKAPEGVPAESAKPILDDIAAFAKAKGLSPEVAQEVAARHFEVLAGIDAANKQLLADHRAQWVEAVKADKDLGDAGVAAAKAAVAKADPTGAFRKLLDATGYGDHPEFVRFAAYWGRQIAEDRVEHANQGGKSVEIDHAAILFPSMKG
jgi:hypothetical protein